MSKIKPRPYLPVGLCLSLGLIITIGTLTIVKKWEDDNKYAQFQQRIDNLTTALNRTIARYTEVLYSLRDFYNSSPKAIQRSQFKSFTNRAVTSYRGIQALEWAKIVSNSEKIAFERDIQNSGQNSDRNSDAKFRIYERDPQGKSIPVKLRAEYIPVLYIHPWKNNEVAFGFDLASDRERRITLEKAKNSGNLATTGRITLVQEQKNQYGFLIFVAIYKNRKLPAMTSTLPPEIEGYVLGVFRVADVIEESLQGISTEIDFRIDDYRNSNQDFFGFYESQAKRFLPNLPKANLKVDSLCPDNLVCSRQITVGNRTWLIQFQPSEFYSKNNRSWLPEVTLSVGLLLTGALAFYLKGAIAELERTKELSELKLRFFSMASHEFRTPLSTILISAQSLDNHDLDRSQRNISKRIQAAAKHMNQLLVDILTISRAEAGKLEFEPEIINLKQFCEQAIAEIEYGLEAPRQIDFKVIGNINPVFLDKKLLRSIIYNLLSNAIKYSTSSVSFQLSGDRHSITLTVGDRGIGIPSEECEKIFDGFYRAQNVGDIEGTGLGMAVVKTCVDLHGGKISLNSELGAGTTFIVTLPMKD